MNLKSLPVLAGLAGLFCSLITQSLQAEDAHRPQNFQRDKLIAWCIVPFDAKQRGPAERADMVTELGLKRVAYDWRAEHVPTFEEEILEYQKHGIEFFAFWSWHDELAPLIEKYDIHPQIWLMIPNPDEEDQLAKVQGAARRLLPMVQLTAKLGCQLGLYNHGGWGGEPENLVAVCKELREQHQASNVGIVYNFHHGHEHIHDFKSSLALMQPHLLCINLNGMADADSVNGLENKIVPIGSGKNEVQMIQTVLDSGYDGPIGILDHRPELDSKESLQLNLDGLDRLFDSKSVGK